MTFADRETTPRIVSGTRTRQLRGVPLALARLTLLLLTGCALLLFAAGIAVQLTAPYAYTPPLAADIVRDATGEVVLHPWNGGDVAAAGVLSGDRLLAVNGVPVSRAPEAPPPDLVDVPLGAPIELVVRTGLAEPRPVTLIAGGPQLQPLAPLAIPAGAPPKVQLAIDVAVALLVTTIAVLIVRHRSDDLAALLSAATLVVVFVGGLSSPVQALYGLAPRWVPLLDRWFGVAFVCLLAFLLLFPDGRPAPRASLVLLTGTVAWMAAASMITPELFPWRMLPTVELTLICLVLAAGIGAQIYRFQRVSGPVERQQTRWVVAGAVAAGLGLALHMAAGRALDGDSYSASLLFATVIYPVVRLLQAALPLAIAAAILQYRLYDIDLLINRTLAHAGLTLAITMLYLLIVAGTASLSLDRRGGLLSLLLATAASAVLIRPLHRRIRAGVDRVVPVPQRSLPVETNDHPRPVAGGSRRAWLAWTLLLTTSGVSLFGFGWLHLAGCGPVLDAQSYSGWLVALAYAGIGFLIVRAQPASRIGWLFLAASPLATYFSGAFVLCAGAGIIPPLGLAPLTWIHFVLFNLYGLAVYILIPLWFPDGRDLSPAWRTLTRVLLGLIALTVAGKAVAPELLEPGMPDRYANPLGVDWLPPWWSTFFAQANILLLLSGVMLGGAAIVTRLWRATGVEQQQLKWLSYYFVVAIGVQILIFELPGVLWRPEIFQSVWYLPVAMSLQVAYPLVVGATLFRYRLYDIDRIINRTLVYGGLSAAIVACYALIVSGLSVVFHMQQSFLSAVLATGVVALLAQPLRERLQKGVNRLMFGERDEPYAVLSQLGRQLQQSVLPEQILPATAETICQTLKLPYVAISIQRGDGERQVVATSGRPAPTTAEWPMQFRGELVGWLAVAPRSPGEGFAPDERRLLADIANQSGAVAASVRLTADLQRAREALVLAREEERRRIRRDLHDELGPTLASQTLRLDAAIDLPYVLDYLWTPCSQKPVACRAVREDRCDDYPQP
ncbi:histidine kinase [Candidatus Chloroploca sp. Khr17]|uniref:histidine kinase n=1 Tax=Candidatus Chloroploca sp. Khr17 TaxID=2496869 RepID=UPI00101B5AF7|nr:histidine kinase [Candidatus Chloroploca sp. Khr17]